ncbi:MAG: hypothetical protein KTR31_14935 [Myxococcales bacterium]|nr:hypothetical protein [Myxococcales bacterium]
MGRRRRSLIGRNMPSTAVPTTPTPEPVDAESVVSDEDAPTVEGALTPELLEALRLDAEIARTTTPPPAPATRHTPGGPRVEQRRPVPSTLSRPREAQPYRSLAASTPPPPRPRPVTPPPAPQRPPEHQRLHRPEPAPTRASASPAPMPRQASPTRSDSAGPDARPRPRSGPDLDSRYWIVAAGLVGAVGISVGIMMLLGWLLLEWQ